MEKSSTIIEIAKALSKFQSIVKPAIKNGENPFFHSKYATLDDVLETIHEPLEKTGLSFSQFPTGEDSLTTILMHTSGEFLQSTAKMSPKDETPQGQGSAITYMRRYALSAILGIATEDDDDANKASKPTSATKTPYKSKTSEPKASKTQSPKVKIAHLLSLLKFDTQFASPEDIRTEILKLTSLEATEENYGEIVSRLEVIVKENQEVVKNSKQ